MVMADHNTMKEVVISLCTKIIDVMETAILYYEGTFRRFSTPSCIIPNQSHHFSSKVFQELARLCNFKLFMSTAYHPQTNEETKQMNQVFEV